MIDNKFHSTNLTMSCQSQNIEDVVQKIISKVEKIDPDISDLNFRIKIAVREMLANAIVHGCADKGEISIELDIYNDQVKLKVKDPGEGFDHENASFNKVPVDEESGRGLIMINEVADKVVFNEKGNAISVFFKVSK